MKFIFSSTFSSSKTSESFIMISVQLSCVLQELDSTISSIIQVEVSVSILSRFSSSIIIQV